jgi:hypothetical protein
MEAKRNIALDIVKGICVVGMVVHHSMDYFLPVAVELKYVRFISGAFLFLAGFVCTHIYFSRYDPGRDSVRIGRRLVTRGLKLLLIVLVLNIAIALLPGFSHKAKSVSLPQRVLLVLWSGTYREVSFALLAPIGYVLMAVGFIVLVLRSHARNLVWIALALFVYCSGWHFSQETGYYLRYFTIGLLGAACGLIPDERLDRVCKNLSMISLIFLALLCAISYLRTNFPFYAANVAISLMFLYALSMKTSSQEWVAGKTILTGNHTLVCYLFQILLLQALKPAMRRVTSSEELRMVLATIITLIAMLAFCEVLDLLRRKSDRINTLYKALFA